MLLFRYIIENLRFFYRWLHPNFKLITVDFNQIRAWERLNKKNGREVYFPLGKLYDWDKLKKSLNTLGYIPSIVVNLYTTKPDYTYTIKNGNHRFFILSEKVKETEKIKVWVHKKSSKKVKKFVEVNNEIQRIINNNLNKMEDNYKLRSKNSPNYERLKDKL